MSLNDEAVRAGITGAVYVGAVGVAMPVDVTTPLATPDFAEVGLIDPDALTETLDISKTVLKAWQRKSGVRTLTTDTTWSFKFKAMETSPLVRELYYGGTNTPGTAPAPAKFTVPNNPTNTERAFVFEIVDGDITERYCLPKGDITDRGDLAHSPSEGSYYELTVTVLGTADDNLGWLLTNDPAFAATTP